MVATCCWTLGVACGASPGPAPSRAPPGKAERAPGSLLMDPHQDTSPTTPRQSPIPGAQMSPRPLRPLLPLVQVLAGRGVSGLTGKVGARCGPVGSSHRSARSQADGCEPHGSSNQGEGTAEGRWGGRRVTELRSQLC